MKHTMKLQELIFESLVRVKKNAKQVGIEVTDKLTANIIAGILSNPDTTKEELETKISTGFQIAAAIEGVNVRVVRPVGRPRSRLLDSEVVTVKRPVGRPKLVRVETTPAEPKRPVGRPRKNPQLTVAAKSTRPVGRPRKNHSTPTV